MRRYGVVWQVSVALPGIAAKRESSSAYAYPYVGWHNAKLFEIEPSSGTARYLFYAEGYFNQGVAMRTLPGGGYAQGPGNSALYVIYDLEACRGLDSKPVHESAYHLTGEGLPNVTAVFEYESNY
jgi:hypothetical protein